jgi:hypothetical protein
MKLRRLPMDYRLRFLLAFLFFPLVLGPVGFLAWLTMRNSPLYWLLYILIMALSWMSGSRLGVWASKGHGGWREECVACHHWLGYHPDRIGNECNQCDCRELTQERLDELDAELAEEERRGEELKAAIADEVRKQDDIEKMRAFVEDEVKRLKKHE